MFITLYAYRVSPGQLPAIRCLYKEWQQLLGSWNEASIELLSNNLDPTDLILLARFQNEDTAWAAIESPAYRAWYAQLVRLAEVGPTVSHYRNVES